MNKIILSIILIGVLLIASAFPAQAMSFSQKAFILILNQTASVVVAVGDFLNLQNGDAILLQNGDEILLQGGS